MAHPYRDQTRDGRAVARNRYAEGGGVKRNFYGPEDPEGTNKYSTMGEQELGKVKPEAFKPNTRIDVDALQKKAVIPSERTETAAPSQASEIMDVSYKDEQEMIPKRKSKIKSSTSKKRDDLERYGPSRSGRQDVHQMKRGGRAKRK